MNKLHKELLDEIKKHAGKGTTHSGSDSYLSSGHSYYSVSVPIKRTIARNWVKMHKDIEVSELLMLLDSLFAARSYEEKTMGGVILGYLPKQREEISPEYLDKWLDLLVGWAEIDTLCQSNFTAKELLSNWQIWKSLLKKFSKDRNISKKRASLVLLTASVSNSENQELADLSFEIIEELRSEKDILITKAISWLLRSLIKYHKNDVKIYLDKNEQVLPKIAVRETRNKLATGKK